MGLVLVMFILGVMIAGVMGQVIISRKSLDKLFLIPFITSMLLIIGMYLIFGSVEYAIIPSFYIILILSVVGYISNLMYNKNNTDNYTKNNDLSSVYQENKSIVKEDDFTRNDYENNEKDFKKKVLIVSFIAIVMPLILFVCFAFNTYMNPIVLLPVLFTFGLLFFFLMLFNDIKERIDKKQIIILIVSAVSFLPMATLLENSMILMFLPLFLMIVILPLTVNQLVKSPKNNNDTIKSGYLKHYDSFSFELFGVDEKINSPKDFDNALSGFYKKILQFDEEHQKKNFLSKAVSIFIPLPLYLIKDANTNSIFIGAPRDLLNKDNWNYRMFKNYSQTFRDTYIFHLNTVKNVNSDYWYYNEVIAKEGLSKDFRVKKIVIYSNVPAKYEGYLILEKII